MLSVALTVSEGDPTWVSDVLEEYIVYVAAASNDSQKRQPTLPVQNRIAESDVAHAPWLYSNTKSTSPTAIN